MAQITSTILNSATMTMEGSDSNNSSSSNTYSQHKRLRRDNPENSTSSSYKGVVWLQNGHWGAQIYYNHQRTWLGTFKSEKAAAMAYDSAAIKLRSGDSHRNFPWTNITIQEPAFQARYTTEAVLNMIKDGSYQSEFAEYIRTQLSKTGTSGSLIDRAGGFINQEGDFCQLLFQKELTVSDVGKLNRFVIPKKHALRFFPLPIDAGTEGVQLEFLEYQTMQLWKFRYCYWKSSQNFVLTRGWNRFVKDKNLKAKDKVIFYRCEERKVLYINARCSHGSDDAGSGSVAEKKRLALDLGGCFTGESKDSESNEKPEVDLGGSYGGGLSNKRPKELVIENNPSSFRLFGEDIQIR